jgi:gliding motility-associated protein GldM
MNPEKAGKLLTKANEIKSKTSAIYDEIEQLKKDIVVAADGPEGDYNNIQNKDNLDVSAQIAIPSTMPIKETRGVKLKENINKYVDELKNYIDDPNIEVEPAKKERLKELIAGTFNTEDKKGSDGQNISWETARFSSMPVSACITLLTKLQADLVNTESQVVSFMRDAVRAGDFRVNKITAEVIPVSSYITRGGTYEARIILAAIDSTQQPEITVDGQNIEGGIYKANCDRVGTYPVEGKIILKKQDGTTTSYPFKSEYIVGEPTAIVSADLMNVFYAGYNNPISVSVPGVAAQNISISVTNASMTKTAKGWNIKPSKAGQNCKITVSTKGPDGKFKAVGAAKEFRVKALPTPTAYISYQKDGREQEYRGQGKPISKANLISAPGLRANLKDADLDVKYRVTGFDITTFDSMGNALIKSSNSAQFTSEQKAMMNKLGKGKKFFISRIRAVGEDGIENVLPAIDVSIN